ncbi:MAG TPA: TDT family transporter [Solirubrobacterales bacterium]|nr:TDT family transporter [Solirubrobacterales bacterium]
MGTDSIALPLRRRQGSFLCELERPSHAFRDIGPNWFAAVMGTGIIANAAALLPFDWPAARELAIGPWLLAVFLLVAVTAATVVHWVRHPERARANAADPTIAPFYGCPPMALLTVGAGTLLVGSRLIGPHAAVVVDSVLWGLGTALGLLTMVLVPAMLIHRRDLDPRRTFATWLLPVVPPTVSAATGAALIPHLPTPGLQQAMLLGCYAILGASLVLSLLTIALLWFRLIYVDQGPARMVPTLWLVLGPLGQSVTAFGLLGPHAGELLEAPYGVGLEAFGVVYGLPVWGFAIVWMTIAALITLRALRRGLPFSLTWWSFTFPVGTVATGTAELAAQTGAQAFAWLAVCTFALLLVGWAAAFANTVRGTWSGALFLPPPREPAVTSPA